MTQPDAQGFPPPMPHDPRFPRPASSTYPWHMHVQPPEDAAGDTVPTPLPPAPPAVPPVDEAGSGGDGTDGVPPQDVPPRPRRRRGLAWALALSLVAVVGLAVALVMLLLARSTWESENAALREQVAVLTDDVSESNDRLTDLVATHDQLVELKREYSELVNDAVTAPEVEEELGDLIASYQECVDAQQRHFDVLRNADRYVASSVLASEQSIVEFCDEIERAYLDYRASRE